MHALTASNLELHTSLGDQEGLIKSKRRVKRLSKTEGAQSAKVAREATSPPDGGGNQATTLLAKL